MPKKKIRKRLIAELLFWLHTAVMLTILFLGLFVPFWWVIVTLIVVRLQQVILHGCFLTLLEIKAGGLPKGHVYMQLVSQRFFKHRLTRRRGVRNAVALHLFLTILIALLASHFNYRIQL